MVLVNIIRLQSRKDEIGRYIQEALGAKPSTVG